MIGIANASTQVSSDYLAHIIHALNVQMRRHLAPTFAAQPIPVLRLADPAHAPAGSWVLTITDNADQAGDLGWHTEAQGDVIFGNVFVQPILEAGGDILTLPLSVSSVLSHELCETFGDPRVNMWADNGTGTAYAYELSDPTEGDSYGIEVPGFGPPVTVSNFVTPHWFDPFAGAHERMDWLGLISSPFVLRPGGYSVTMAEGQVTEIFGEHYVPNPAKDPERGRHALRLRGFAARAAIGA